ncbi:hypothetical protein [Novosphingobium mangrovi (ex Hu et al. 2023)]|uniref:Na+-dependent transporter n=1 Tax=Novosphingobium mangrovi (ex Hu et al. 2023) TaxID=2930094 RepID=A0ABT0A804_9SPHN|nr:hypothetical protein [Novosphingobium mangrovi (ex Hu et al. 2023)]MCJ1959329.1 hypothetical protein [Novosphingobium mangrovi (ex Hu et al. 2023)]
MSLLFVLKLALAFSIMLMVFALALRARVADLGYMVVHWREGLGALAAMYLVVPAVAIVLAGWLDISPDVKVALVAIAFSPLPPILPAKQLKMGASAGYATGLLVMATLASILIAPWGMPVAAALLKAHAHSLTPMSVAAPLLVTVLIPLVLGLIARPLLGPHVDKVGGKASRAGTILLLLGVVGLSAGLIPAISHVVGQGTLLVLALAVVAGVLAGYMLGGKEVGNRKALALAAASRHPGAAIAIATHSFPHAAQAPAAIALAAIVSGLVCVPILKLMERP